MRSQNRTCDFECELCRGFYCCFPLGCKDDLLTYLLNCHLIATSNIGTAAGWDNAHSRCEASGIITSWTNFTPRSHALAWRQPSTLFVNDRYRNDRITPTAAKC